MSTLALGNVKTESLDSGSGTIQTTGAIVANTVTGASVLASTLNAATSSTGATTTTNLTVNGLLNWSNYNSVTQSNTVNIISLTLVDILTGSPTPVVRGSVFSGQFTTSILPAGTYEIRMSLNMNINTTTLAPNIALTFDGVQLFNLFCIRTPINTCFQPFYFSRTVVFATATNHTFRPQAHSNSASFQVAIRDFQLSIHRVV